MISKELLSEVLGRYVVEFKNESWLKSNNTIVYTLKDEESEDFINIYELANKCKEWALSKDYYLRAEQGINYYDNLQWTCFLNINMDDGAEYIDYWNSTEPEAIFKACQWILDNKEIK